MRFASLLILLSVALLMFVAVFDLAQAHDFYPRDCCPNRDCYPVGESDLTPAAGGWRVEATGEVLPYTSTKVRQTPAEADAPYHRCSSRGDRKATTYCIFVPGFGS
jgi:hypothetical protein